MINKYGIYLLIVFLGACGVALEVDIRNDELNVIAPTDQAVMSEGDIHFRWELLEGATEYELFIASPSFGSIEKVALDTAIQEENSFVRALGPGSYEWSLRAANSGYFTATSTRSFTIPDSAELFDISASAISLQVPTQEMVPDEVDSTVTFSWDEVADATHYNLLVMSPTIAQPKKIWLDTQIVDNRVVFEMKKNGSYEWGVSASNKWTETKLYNTKFSIKYP